MEIGQKRLPLFHFLFSIFLCAFVFTAAAFAQDYTPQNSQLQGQVKAQDYSHARIVRLSLVEGDVQIARPEDEGWEEAISNLPIRQGDSLATFRGRAEIEFESGATAYMAPNTRLQFTELALADGARITRLTLSAGAAVFYANLDKRDTFAVISPGVTVEIPKNARFRMDVRDDRTNVAVTKGDVTVASAAGNYKLGKNDGLLFYVAGQNIQLGRIGEPDDFDRWVNDRENSIHTARASSLRYVNAPFRYGLSDLSYHGNWIYESSYGYAWQPYGVGLGWGPYVSGRWVFLRHHGWTWVSYEPWGWVPYHYGRWAHTHYGWVWVPGYFNYWSPAHVVWFQFGPNFGWCPLGPFDRPGPRGVFGRPRHFNNGVVVSTAGGVVQGSRNPGILRSELTGEPLNRPPTRAEVFGGSVEGASGAPARPASGFAGTRRDPDAPRGAAGAGPERAGRGDRDNAPRESGETGVTRTAPAGFSGRPSVDGRGDADRADPDRDGRPEARPRSVPMSPEVMREPRPRDVNPNGNVDFDRDEKKFVNRPSEGVEREPGEGRANPTPRPDASGPRSDSSAPRTSNGFAGATGVPRTGEPRPEASGRTEPAPRDVTLPRGSDSSPAPRSEPTPRSDNNAGYGSRPSSQGASPSGGYGGSQSSSQSSAPRPSAQPSQSSQPRPSSPPPQAQPRPSSPPRSNFQTQSQSRPSSPPPQAQPRPSSPPRSNFQTQSQSRPSSPRGFGSAPRPSSPPSAPAHKPRPN